MELGSRSGPTVSLSEIFQGRGWSRLCSWYVGVDVGGHSLSRFTRHECTCFISSADRTSDSLRIILDDCSLVPLFGTC